jgi:tetratricopeptide (TPR) repeat protein
MTFYDEIRILREKKLEFVPFVTLKKGAEIPVMEGNFVLDRELEIPLLLEDFINDVKESTVNEGLSMENICTGMCFMLGADPEFIYHDYYLEILNKSKANLQSYIIHLINKFGEKLEYSVIFALALVEIETSARNLFILGSCLENLAKDHSDKKNSKKSEIFFDEAVKYYHSSCDEEENFTLSLYKLGFYYRGLGQYVRAKDYWDRFMEHDQDSVRIEEVRTENESLEKLVDYEIGYSYVLDGNTEDGLEKLLPLVEYFPDWWNLLFVIGLAFRQNLEYEIASDYFKNVLFMKADQKEALNELAICYLNMNKFKEAEEILDNAIILSENNSELLANRSVSRIYLDKIKEAEEDIDKALEINPNDEIAINIKKEIEKMK